MPSANWRDYPSGVDERFRVQERNTQRGRFEPEWNDLGAPPHQPGADERAHTSKPAFLTAHAAIVYAKSRALSTGTPHRVLREDPLGQKYGIVAHSHQVLEYKD